LHVAPVTACQCHAGHAWLNRVVLPLTEMESAPTLLRERMVNDGPIKQVAAGTAILEDHDSERTPDVCRHGIPPARIGESRA
jgi:hypothetical protein